MLGYWRNAGRAVFDSDLTAIHLHRPFRDGQAETCAAMVSRPPFIQSKKTIVVLLLQS